MNDAKIFLPAAIAGDRHAQQQLLLEHYDRLEHRVHKRLTGPLAKRYSVEDVLQEAFATAIRDFGKCRAESMPAFGAWLNSVVDNRMRDLRKHLGTQKRDGYRREVRMATNEASSLVNILEVLAEETTVTHESDDVRQRRHPAVGLPGTTP